MALGGGFKMSKHARTTISVPSELKARMEAVDEPVNWSALACQAFEQRLAEIIKRKGSGDMNDVVSRLRVSKRKLENEQFQAGIEAGRVWAKDEAEAGELIRLAEWRNAYPGTDWEVVFAADDRAAYCSAEHFVFGVWPENDGDRSAANDFWEPRGFEATHPSGDYVRGFAEGALAIWHEVKDQL
jgi:hypothetical protein